MTGLEAFKDVLYILSAVSNNEIDTNCETIKTIEKSLKALEIIKEKRVDLCILTDCDNVNEYNKSLGNSRPIEDRLTYEEFDTLKRYLG